MVGNAIATKLVQLGHDVLMGSRSATNEKATAWADETGDGASHSTYADAASHGEILFNCTNGKGTLEALGAAGADAMRGKLLLELANPLHFSKGDPPTLFVNSDDSLGEQVQRAFPDTKVVKTLNTVHCKLMVDPGRVPGRHTVFMSGDDEGAKKQVHDILTNWFGWQHVLDLGDISTSRGTEAYLMLWIRTWGLLGTGDFNVSVVTAD
jgi:hypothetical protein